MAFHFNGLGDTERAFYYFSTALASFEEAVQAIGDGAMIHTFMQSEVVGKFKREAQLFIERHCPGLREDDAKLPRDIRTVFQSLKKGFFECSRCKKWKRGGNKAAGGLVANVAAACSSTVAVNSVLDDRQSYACPSNKTRKADYTLIT